MNQSARNRVGKIRSAFIWNVALAFALTACGKSATTSPSTTLTSIEQALAASGNAALPSYTSYGQLSTFWAMSSGCARLSFLPNLNPVGLPATTFNCLNPQYTAPGSINLIGCPNLTYDTLSNGSGAPLRLDLYLPGQYSYCAGSSVQSSTGSGQACSPSGSGIQSRGLPLVVDIHGGGFFVGDRHNGSFADIIALTQKGYAVASITYRLTQINTSIAGESIPPLSNWTDPVKDIKAAIVWLKVNSGVFIDPNRVAIFGHSAGGFFSSLVSASNGNSTLEDFSRAIYANNPNGYTSAVQASIVFNGPNNFSLFGNLTAPASPYTNSRIASSLAPSLAQTSTYSSLNGTSIWYGELFLNGLGNPSPFQIPNATAATGAYAGPLTPAGTQAVTAADPSTYITQNATSAIHLVPSFFYYALQDQTVPFSMGDNVVSTINSHYAPNCTQLSSVTTGANCNTISGLTFAPAQPCTYVRDPTGNHAGAFSLIRVLDYANFLGTFLP